MKRTNARVPCLPSPVRSASTTRPARCTARDRGLTSPAPRRAGSGAARQLTPRAICQASGVEKGRPGSATNAPGPISEVTPMNIDSTAVRQDTAKPAHVVDPRTQFATIGGALTGSVRYRWRCSCGARSRRWHSSGQHGQHAGQAARRARNGGVAHVRAMERAR